VLQKLDSDPAFPIHALAQGGYAIVREWLPAAVIAGLRERARSAQLAPAGIGRAAARATRTDIRGDRIAWLGHAPRTGAEARLAKRLEDLRTRCNRELMLGLVEVEAHYAAYAPGARYARHRDRFRDDDTRVLSCVLYLNEAWTAGDGGALRLYLPGDAHVDVLPEGGTLVAFLSAEFDHEVLPAALERWSLACWFRRRGLP
jgi:SM-20-related protein